MADSGKKTVVLLLPVFLLLCGCGSVGLREVGGDGRSEYWDVTTGHRDLAPDTVNLLGNYLLHDLYDSAPEQFVERLQQLYLAEPRREVLAALADCSLQIGYREHRDPDFAARFILGSLLYCSEYIKNQDRECDPYNIPDGFLATTIAIHLGKRIG